MHITRRPSYQQSNGFIEHMVQTVKITLEKAKQSRMDDQLALLSLRTTPLDSHLPSPAEILYDRKMRTRIPTLLNTNNPKDNQIRKRMNKNSKKQQQYYNRNAKDLHELIIGSKVSILQENDTWLPATVNDKCTELRSYIVKMQDDGKLLRRNRRHAPHIIHQLKGLTQHHNPN